MHFIGVVSGASGAYNNQSTGVSGLSYFAIPQSVKAFYFVPGASGLLFEMFRATGPTGNTTQTTATRGAQLTGPGVINGPFKAIQSVGTGAYHLVSFYNSATTGFSVKVFAAPTS